MFNIETCPYVTPWRTRTSIPLNICVQELNPNENTSLYSIQDSCTDDDTVQLAFFVEFNKGLSGTNACNAQVFTVTKNGF